MSPRIILAAALLILGGACQSTTRRPGPSTTVVRGDPLPASKDPDAQPTPREPADQPKDASELSATELHSGSFALREQARRRILAESKPGSWDYDLAELHLAEGLPLDETRPEVPAVARNASRRLQQRALEGGGGETVSQLLAELAEPRCAVRPLIALILAPVPGRDVYEGLARAVADAGSGPLRRAAAAALGERSDPEAGLALLPALLDPYATNAAIGALLRLSRSDPQRYAVEEGLLKALASDELSRLQRLRLFEVAAHLQTAPAGPVIGRWLHPEADALLAEGAAAALAFIPGRFVVERLREGLEDPRPGVRARVVEALAAQGDALSAETLRVLARRDPHHAVRRACVLALGRLRDQSAQRAVLAALQDSAWQVRAASAETAGELGFVEAIPVLRGWLDGAREPETRAAAALALGRLGDLPSTPGLTRALNATTPLVRSAAARALAAIGRRASAEALVEGLPRQSAEVRVAALREARRGLSRRPDERARPEPRPEATEVLAAWATEEARSDAAGPVLRAAAAAYVFESGRSEAASSLASVGEQMLELIASDDVNDRRLGRLLLLEIANRDFSYDPEASADDRARITRQIEPWWSWRRSQLVSGE